jgi:hypothetical protein
MARPKFQKPKYHKAPSIRKKLLKHNGNGALHLSAEQIEYMSEVLHNNLRRRNKEKARRKNY